MNEFVELRQAPDDSWTIEVMHSSGIVEAIQLPQLSKDQAIREATRRGYDRIRCWDKTVLAALASGKAALP